jgi:hypothetical protein
MVVAKGGRAATAEMAATPLPARSIAANGRLVPELASRTSVPVCRRPRPGAGLAQTMSWADFGGCIATQRFDQPLAGLSRPLRLLDLTGVSRRKTVIMSDKLQ